MIFLSWLNATKNLWLIGAGAALVMGIFVAGQVHEKRKTEAEIAAVNVPIAEQRGKDEAEIAAERDAASRTDAVVSANLKQSLILNEETARLVNSVR